MGQGPTDSASSAIRRCSAGEEDTARRESLLELRLIAKLSMFWRWSFWRQGAE